MGSHLSSLAILGSGQSDKRQSCEMETPAKDVRFHSKGEAMLSETGRRKAGQVLCASSAVHPRAQEGAQLTEYISLLSKNIGIPVALLSGGQYLYLVLGTIWKSHLFGLEISRY